MPKNQQQKKDIVLNIADKLSRAKSLVFANYQGLTMAELSLLRSQLRESGAEFSITKNNLLKIALDNSHLSINDPSLLTGPVATLFAFQDEITPIKTLVKALKDAQKGNIKGGLISGEFLDQLSINKLAQLPSAEELKAKVVGSLGAPLYNLVGVLHANLANFVYTIEQIRLSRG